MSEGSHVVLEGSDVALEVQQDVARQGSEYSEEKRRKNVSHVVLGGSDVALEVQQDVARQESGGFESKRAKKREPRRIGR